ncbi:MAG: hypothetical protein ACLGHN_03975, partial [Bacteriovoracia bacterium]
MSKFTILFIVLLFISLPSWGEDSLSYTGRLVNTDGSPVAGPVDLKLELAYIDDADVSIFSVKCTKTLSSVPLTNGVFHVKISYSSTECGGNSIAKILASVPSGESPGIRVTDVTDPLAPKAYSFQGIHSVPYASVSKTLFQNGATNGQVLMWNGSEWTPAGVTVGSSDITDGSIVDADVASGAAIAQSKIANLTTDLASKQPLDDDLTALSGLAGTGVLVRTGAGAATTRQIEG